MHLNFRMHSMEIFNILRIWSHDTFCSPFKTTLFPLTVTTRDDYTPTVRGGSVLPWQLLWRVKRLKLTLIMFYYCQKNLDSWSEKCHFRSIFGSFPVKFPLRKKFWKIFIAPKDSSLNFRGSRLNYFRTIVLISAVISILEYFGSLPPAHDC